VRKIINEVSMIESVDSLSLAGEISRQAVNNKTTMDVLLEVNIGNEESKTGFSPDKSLIKEASLEISGMKGIALRGIMAVPPICEKDEEIREYFYKTRVLYEDVKGVLTSPEGFNTLSLGMSGDYEAAIEEGSTLIRVGSALFGMRRY